MSTHFIHKSTDKVTAELLKVNAKLDQLLASTALADIAAELAYIRKEVAKSALPNDVEDAIRKIPKELDDISKAVGKSALPNDVEDAIRKIPKELDDIAKEIDKCCGPRGTTKSKGGSRKR